MKKPRAIGSSRRDFMRGAAAAGIGAGTVSGATMLAAMNNEAMAQGEPIPLGSMVPLTGWGGADAIEFQRGVTMAVDEINNIGGILGRPIVPHFEDTKVMTSDVVTAAARRLIDRFAVHAIINGYNSPSLRAEYDTIADAGVPYLHDNTDYGHHPHIAGDPERYFNIFMCDPAEWYYGPAIMLFIDQLEKSGKWKRPNNKLALLPGQFNYNTVIAQGIRENAKQYGWEFAVDQIGAGGGHGDLDPAYALAHLRADLQELEADGAAGGGGELGVSEPDPAQRFEQDVSEGREPKPELVGAHGRRRRAVGEQIELLLLDNGMDASR
jgi:branched-chain amino acid transport system substrate-binding protein